MSSITTVRRLDNKLPAMVVSIIACNVLKTTRDLKQYHLKYTSLASEKHLCTCFIRDLVRGEIYYGYNVANGRAEADDAKGTKICVVKHLNTMSQLSNTVSAKHSSLCFDA